MVQILYPYTAGGHLGSALGEGLQKGMPEGVQRGLFSAALSGAAKAASDPNLTDQERMAKVMQALSLSPEATKFAFGKSGIMGGGGGGGAFGGSLGGTPGRTVGGGGAGEEGIFAPGAAVPGTSFTQGGWLGQQMEFGDQAAFDKYFPKKPGTSITGREFTEGDIQSAQEQMARAGYSNERIARLTARAQSLSTQAQKQKQFLFNDFNNELDLYNADTRELQRIYEKANVGERVPGRTIINDEMRNRMQNWTLMEAEKEFKPGMTKEEQKAIITAKATQAKDALVNAEDVGTNWIGRVAGLRDKRFEQAQSSVDTLMSIIGPEATEKFLTQQGLSYVEARAMTAPPSEEERKRREAFIKETGKKELPSGIWRLAQFAKDYIKIGGVTEKILKKEEERLKGEADVEKLRAFFKDLPRDANFAETRSWAVSHGFDPKRTDSFADMIKNAIVEKYGSLTAKQKADYDYMKRHPVETSMIDFVNDQKFLERIGEELLKVKKY